jgi:hypothetical protein
MSKTRIDAKALVDFPAGTRFTTPDANGTVYTLEAARYSTPHVLVYYTIPGACRSQFHVLGMSTIYLVKD